MPFSRFISYFAPRYDIAAAIILYAITPLFAIRFDSLTCRLRRRLMSDAAIYDAAIIIYLSRCHMSQEITRYVVDIC